MAGMGTPGGGQAGMPTRLAYKRYFVRFDVSGRPLELRSIPWEKLFDPKTVAVVGASETEGTQQRHQWIQVRDRLASVSAIRKIDLLSLSRQEAKLEVKYIGSQDQLKSSLAEVSLDHVRGEVIRELERRFPPELRNRIDEVVLFSPLTHGEVREIALAAVRDGQDSAAARRRAG